MKAGRLAFYNKPKIEYSRASLGDLRRFDSFSLPVNRFNPFIKGFLFCYNEFMKNKKIIRTLFITGFILLIPLLLQLTIGTGVDGKDFNWQLNDFIIMGVLLFIVIFAIKIVKDIKKPVYRFSLIFVILITFLLIWAELAVGVFGTPFAGS